MQLHLKFSHLQLLESLFGAGVASRVVVELALRSLAAGLKMEKPIQNEWIVRWIEASWISESAGAGFAERLLRDQATPPGQPC